MSAGNELRRRVVVLDPILRSREHMRRAIRALGHAPLVFNDLEELSQLRGKLLRCSALCVGLPPNPGDQQLWVRAARSLIGRDVPLLFLARENPVKATETLRCTAGDVVLAAPISFADVHKGMKAYNDALSLERANTVRDLMVRAGVDQALIKTSGVGKTRPVPATPGATLWMVVPPAPWSVTLV